MVATTLADQQRTFDRFRRDYNECRRHEALDQSPPAHHYEPSLRPMPSKLLTLDYDERFLKRKVDSAGNFRWNGVNVSAGTPLAGLWVRSRKAMTTSGPCTRGLRTLASSSCATASRVWSRSVNCTGNVPSVRDLELSVSGAKHPVCVRQLPVCASVCEPNAPGDCQRSTRSASQTGR